MTVALKDSQRACPNKRGVGPHPLPDGWTVAKLGEICSDVFSGRSGKVPGGRFPLYGSTGQIGSCDGILYDGDAILVARVGANAGTTNCVSGTYGVTDNTIIIKADSNVSTGFLHLKLVSANLNSMVFGSGQPLITGTQLKNLDIPLPPLPEQRAIAEALGDVDALIAAQEKLIAKKRAIKTATMQRLLTGKQRLPGFGEGCGYKQTEIGVIPEDWKVALLDDVLSSARLGSNYPNSTEPTGKPLIKMGNIGRGDIILDKLEYIPKAVKVKPYDRLKYGDVLFNTRNTLELVGKVSVWRDEMPEAYYNSNLLRLDFKPNLIGDNFFANLALNSKYAVEQLRGFATGTTSVAAIYTRDLKRLILTFPSTTEQKTIACVLNDLHDELSALEKRLSKTKAIKQGMMQELLTGRTRLV